MLDMAEILRITGKYYDPTDRASVMAYKDPATECLMNYGIVEDNKDPDGLGRLKVRLVTLHPDAVTPWIPMIRPFCGKEAGFFILPDKGEQVLVIHIGGCPNRPVVLASMYTPRNGIDPKGNDDNVKKFYRSQNGLVLMIDDTDGEETISLSMKDGDMRLKIGPKGVEIVNDLGDIKIKAKKVVIEAEDLLAKSEKETKIETGDDLKLKSSKGIKLKADQDVELKGQKIKLKGSMGVAAGGKQIAVKDDMAVGVDMHIVMVPSPSGQVPTPLPHPFMGKLNDKLSDDVEIGGKKAAVKGSKAKFDSPGHFPMPPGTSFQNNPKNEAEVSGGCCDKVKINGKDACTLGSQATSCDDTGSQNQSTIVAMGAAVPIPLMVPNADPLSFKIDGGFVLNTRNPNAGQKQAGQDKKPKLSNAKWGSSSAKVGEEVTLEVSCSDLYSGATVYFTIWEEGFDPAVDVPVAKVRGSCDGSKAEAKWTWFYRPEDWPEPFTEKPKFVFTAQAFKCEMVESGSVEFSQSFKINVFTPTANNQQERRYKLIRDNDFIEGQTQNGVIEKNDLIPGEYELHLFDQ